MLFSCKGGITLTIGEKIRLLRDERGISAAGLAVKTQIGQSTIYVYENDRQLPTAGAIYRICKFFQVSSDWLIGLSESRTLSSIQIETIPVLGGSFVQRMFEAEAAVRVPDNSMLPIREGDIAYLQKGEGELIWTGEKLRKMKRTGGSVRLIASNPDYASEVVSGLEFDSWEVYRVVAMLSKTQ